MMRIQEYTAHMRILRALGRSGAPLLVLAVAFSCAGKHDGSSSVTSGPGSGSSGVVGSGASTGSTATGSASSSNGTGGPSLNVTPMGASGADDGAGVTRMADG